MKILYIANARIPTEKAHGLQIVKTIEAFASLGNEITLFIPCRKNRIREDLFTFYNIKKEFEIIYSRNYLSFLEAVHENIYFRFQRFFFTISALANSMKIKADIIYTREILIAFLLSIFRKRVVFEDHEPKKSKKFFYKLFLKTIKKKVIVAYNLADLYNKFGVDSRTYIVAPNGVDLAEFENINPDKSIWQKEFGLKPEDKVILYVGHFYRWKGVYTLLDSSRHLDQGMKIVMIGGTGKDQREAKNYIKEKNLQNIYLQDFIPHQKVIKYIKSADVLVLPNTAREERSAEHTTPIKLFEYLVSGAPIVASRLKSFAKYLVDRKNSLLFEPDNEQDLAGKIKLILNDSRLAQNISCEAERDGQEYSWENRAGKILEFINN